LEYAPEANKLLKKDGNYYFLHNGCFRVDGISVRMAWVMKSSCIYGTHCDGSAGDFENPGRYEHIQSPMIEGFREPCQGNFIDAITQEGQKWYFFTHHGQTDVDGRPCSLLPVIWKDEWPVIKGRESEGRMIWNGLEKPFPETNKVVPETSDDFNDSVLGHRWMWNFQPRDEMWSLLERPGFLRLYAFQPLAADRIETAGNTLLQRNYRFEHCTAVARFDLAGMQNGQNSGLLHASGSFYTGIGVSAENGKRIIKLVSDENNEFVSEIKGNSNSVWFKADWDFEFINRFSYSFDGENFKEAGDRRKLIGKDYRGDSIGFFNYNNISDRGYVDIDFIHIKGGN